ncbi:MAG TPA: hypothetical protein VK158_00315 [Acidobacteriota bacterium]|nr:hypothetical protein [Acidobacteriota bacterium]
MSELTEYKDLIDSEKVAKNFGSVMMLALSTAFFIAYTVAPDQMFGVPKETLRGVFLITSSILLLGGIYVRFMHVNEYENEY